ncbi:uncharacterized protein LOC111048704 isoform X2 [Nilaparvata lugens]|uniref:uncharacterized protein LOC111048704 isoform X2 n=1 Tax=Nilaparvata lugens TaxID=108931 RepID=UPI00193E6058|nr:uncharacterized protein LOC111048704 isoform X2 [Nilaparvata lugens]
MVMYFIDSTKQNVEAFDLNPRTGLIASFTCRNVFNLTDSENVGRMSSLTIDTNDKLYVAVCTVGQILVVNPETCELINRISIPNNGISSCTFGGINMDILFVITSDSETNSGKLFQVFNLGCQGHPSTGALLWDASLKVEHLVGGLSQPRGIRWNENNRSLQFADSAKGTIHNFCPLSGTMTSATIGNGGSGLIVPIAGQKDMFVISRAMDLLIAKWDSESSQISTPVILINLSNYEAFNNGAKNWICSGNVDQRGNLWAGTTGMHPDNLKDDITQNNGQIYYVQKGHQVVRKIVDLSMPAGFVWSEDGRKFFFVDSLQFTIAVCDYNEDTGELSSARELFCLSDLKMHGFIGGLTKDTNEMLYAANYFGGQVLVINSTTGQLFRTIKIPSSEVIDCTFGGPNMETLFVLTGRSQSNQTASLYQVTNIGARGYPPTCFLMENSLRTEPVTPALTYGKGAFWDEDEQLLYFCDSSQGTIHSYNPATDRYVTAQVVGAEKSNTNIIIPLKGLKNRFLLGLNNELCTVHWDGKSAETSAPDKSVFVDRKMGIRFNTGKVDSRGRLWAGTTSTECSDLLLRSGREGSLYCLDRLRVVEKFTAVAKVSGLEWSSDHKRLFLVDTIKSRVECYDYDERNSSVSNGKIIYKLAELKRGILYSMTIDMNDTLYVCNNHGSQILMIDSVTGKLLRTLSIPASEILSCAFGGSNLDTLYVTTGNSNPSSEFPHAGSVFAITNIGVRGVSSRKFIVEESIRAEPVTTAFTLASAPHWHVNKQVLYFVATQAATPLFCSYSPSTSKCCFAIVGNGTHTPTMLIPETSQKDAFLVIIRNQLAVVTWDGVSKRTSEPCFIADCDSELQAKRLSVGKVDPQGRLWSGATCNQFETRAQEREVENLLQNDEKNGNLKWNELAVSTQGLEWSVDGKTFYFVNPQNFGVDSFDFDPSTGIISNRKCVFKMEDYNISGSLDAITIDIDGNLYIANNMESQILVVNPETGSILSKILIPATGITGCAFGGANLDILYVTTGQNCANSRPHAGKLFQVKHLGVKGLPGRSVTL